MDRLSTESAWPVGDGQMARRIRAFDWASTPLGPITDWSPQLKTTVEIALGSAFASYVWWGPELIQIYNDPAIDILRGKHPDALGRPAPEVWADVWRDVGDYARRVLDTGVSFTATDMPVLVNRGGPAERAWFTFSYSALRDANGEVAGMHAVAIETTGSVLASERLRVSERRQAFLLQLSDALRPLADPIEIQQQASRLLGEHLGVNRVFYADVEDDACVVTTCYAQGVAPLTGRFPIAMFDRVRVASHHDGDMVAVSDLTTDPRFSDGERASFAAAQVAAFAGVMLVKGGTWVGAFGAQSATPRQWTDEELDLTRDVAERTWSALARAHAEAELRASEERYRHIVEEATDYAIFATDADGRIETWSPGAEAVLGWSAEEVIGLPMSVTFTPEDREAGIPERELSIARDTGSATDVRWHLRRDGRRVFIEGTSYGRRDANGEFRGVLKIGQDITKRRQAEAALRRSEERLQRILNVESVGVLTFDASGKMLQANDAFLAMFGYTAEDLASSTLSWRDLTPPEYAQESERQFRQISKTGRIGPYEKEYLRKDGSRKWMMFVGADLGDNTVVKYAIDISDRKAAEAALRRSEARFRAVANLVPDLLWSTDPAGSTTWYNQRWLDYTGQTEREALGWGWLNAIHPDDQATSRARFLAAIAAGTPWLHEHRICRRDGEPRWFLVRAEPVRDETGRITQWLGSATDIHEERTHREALETRVAEATAELRTLSRRLLEVQEEERRHIARELHDEIGQVLTGLGLQLGTGKGTGEARRIVQELTEQVRQMSMDLRPAALDTYGLLPALEWHFERYQARTGVVVDFRHEGLDRRFPAPVETTAYRVVQEALTNVVRHARASVATVQLFADDDALTISVRDNGQGFDVAAVRPSGGLGGMRERVELIDGTIQIDAAPGEGTVVTVELPLEVADVAVVTGRN